MSNIAVAERCIEAISNRDVDTLAKLSSDDVEIKPLRAVLEDTVYRGRDGIDEWMRDIAETWQELRIEVEEILEPVPGSIVAFVTLHARGHGSAAPTAMQVALTARVRDGLVTHAGTHVDRDAALHEASA